MAVNSLRGMTWDHPRGYSGLEAASAEYRSRTGVGITWERRGLQAFADEPIMDLAERYDLVVLDHPHVGLIAESRSLQPLPMPTDAADMSIGGSLESYIWDGQLWAYPVDAACQMAVKRPDLCQAELLNWEAVLSAEPSDYRMVTPLLPVDAFDMFMTLVAGRGEERLPHSAQRFASDESSLLALQVLKALYRLGPSEAISWNPIKALEALSTTDEFAYSPCLFGYINYARQGFRDHRLVYCDLPSFKGSTLKRGILGGAGIGVSAKSANLPAAMDFAGWVTSEAVQSGLYIENEGQPGHLATWRSLGNDPRYSGFLSGGRYTMEQAWTRPRDVWFLGFVDEVCAVMTDFFTKDLAEDRFLAEINALYRKHRNNGADA